MKTILRTQQLYIDWPTIDSEPWLNVIIQMVETDDQFKPINCVDRWGQVSARVSTIARKTYPFNDPLAQSVGEISISGIATALTAAVIDLIIQKYGGKLDFDSGYIILE